MRIEIGACFFLAILTHSKAVNQIFTCDCLTLDTETLDEESTESPGTTEGPGGDGGFTVVEISDPSIRVQLMSPNYPAKFSPDCICGFKIRGPPGHYIRVDFTGANATKPTDLTAEVFDGSILDANLIESCSKGNCGPIETSSSHALVEVTSELSLPATASPFSISLSFVSGSNCLCGESEYRLEKEGGHVTVSSPGLGSYPHCDCSWTFHPPKDCEIDFQFTGQKDIGDGDEISIFSGIRDSESELLERFFRCRGTECEDLDNHAEIGPLTLRFISDTKSKYRIGFTTVVSATCELYEGSSRSNEINTNRIQKDDTEAETEPKTKSGGVPTSVIVLVLILALLIGLVIFGIVLYCRHKKRYEERQKNPKPQDPEELGRNPNAVTVLPGPIILNGEKLT